MPDNPIVNEYLDLDDDKVVGLYLSVLYWGMISQNSKVTPTNIGTILTTADQFQHWLVN